HKEPPRGAAGALRPPRLAPGAPHRAGQQGALLRPRALGRLAQRRELLGGPDGGRRRRDPVGAVHPPHADPDPVMPLSGVSPQAEQGKRKRNLILISATLVMLIVGSIFEFALRAPQLPVASNLVVLALLNLNVIVFLLLLFLLLAPKRRRLH